MFSKLVQKVRNLKVRNAKETDIAETPRREECLVVELNY